MKSRRSRVRPRVCGASPARWSRGQQTRCSDSLARTSVQSSACAAVRRCASTSRTNSKKTRLPTGTAWMCPRPPTAIRGAIRPGRENVYDFEVFDWAGTNRTTRTHNMRTGAQAYQGLASRFARGAGCRRGRVVHVYYHGAGAETRYAGSMQIGFLRGVAESSRNTQTNITVQKTESITNQSVAGVVTDTPGTYAVTLS